MRSEPTARTRTARPLRATEASPEQASRVWLYAVLATVCVGLGVGAAPVSADPYVETSSDGVIATFEGSEIDLSDGWGDAQACYSEDAASARCYRSEAEMDAAEGLSASKSELSEINKAMGGWNQKSGVAAPAGNAGAATPLSTCSTTVRLYRGTLYTGGVLALATQGTYLNLASYGFDNDTSSYQIGACASRFYDTTSGGTLYPGNTSAGASAVAMLSGWDNRVGSIYIT